MPETIEPVTGTLPLPKAVKPRRVMWTDADLAALILSFHEGERYEGRFSKEKARAKLIKLGLLAKDEKPTLSQEWRDYIGDVYETLYALGDPERTLAVQHALERLRSLLPKRSK
jgi:hypothetical protein